MVVALNRSVISHIYLGDGAEGEEVREERFRYPERKFSTLEDVEVA